MWLNTAPKAWILTKSGPGGMGLRGGPRYVTPGPPCAQIREMLPVRADPRNALHRGFQIMCVFLFLFSEPDSVSQPDLDPGSCVRALGLPLRL